MKHAGKVQFIFVAVSEQAESKVDSSLDTEVIIEREIITLKRLAYIKVHRNMPTPQMQSGAADLCKSSWMFNQTKPWIDKELETKYITHILYIGGVQFLIKYCISYQPMEIF